MGGRRACRWAAVLLALFASVAHSDTQIIDSPTAQPLGHGQMRLEVSAGPEGSVLTGARAGVFDRLDFGVSYGMQEVLGRGSIVANPRPGVQARLQFLDLPMLPALAVGFDSQGHGRWLRDQQRYERKSPGLYAVATQNLLLNGNQLLTSASAGINYSLESNAKGPNLFAGLTQEFGFGLGTMLDYNLGLDDRGGLDAGRGYLDAGVQWRFGAANHLRFLLRDLFGNYHGRGQVARELGFYYLLQL